MQLTRPIVVSLALPLILSATFNPFTRFAGREVPYGFQQPTSSSAKVQNSKNFDGQPCSINVTSVPEGADITVDNKSVGHTPTKLQLAAGDRTISLTKTGFKTWQRTLSVADNYKLTLYVELQKE